MPTIATRTSVLDGRGEIINYERNPLAYYLRVYVKEKRGYKTQRIPDVDNIDNAIECALDMFLSLNSRSELPVKKATSKEKVTVQKGLLVTSAIENFLTYEQNRVDAELIKEKTLLSKKETLLVHLIPYCQSKGIIRTTDFKQGVMDDYLVIRGKECAKLTLKKEIINIGNFIKYLIRHNLVSATEFIEKSIFPPVRIKQSELDGNPPINDDDMKKIWTEMHRWVKEADTHPSPRVKYWRNKFWTFCILLRTTGMRPGEARLLKWKDVEIENRPRTRSNGELEDRFVCHVLIRDTKTGRPREVTSNAADRLMAWHKVVSSYVKTAKNVRGELTPDTYIFGDPHQDEFALTGYHSFLKSWHVLMDRLKTKLRGSKLSDKRYTLYSFRSSRVNELLTEGVDIFIISKQLGHSVSVLQKHYERLGDVRERAVVEAAAISYGKKKSSDKTVVNLFH